MNILMSKYHVKEVLQDPDQKSVRVTFIWKGLVCVVKLFDPKLDIATIKVFLSEREYDAVKSFWNTTVPVEKANPYITQAVVILMRLRHRLKRGLKDVQEI